MLSNKQTFFGCSYFAGVLRVNSYADAGNTGPEVHFFTFSKCTFKIYSFWRDAKSANPGPILLLRVRPGFALIAVCSSVIHRHIQMAMMRRLWW